ncbi:MAG: protein-glutamate O-methyltransferase [Fibrobacterota bacterium]|nr:protein-glutamate O-methyltransferase [Fibrobacterota bacterium]
MNLDTKSYDEFRTLVYEVSGINLGKGKEALVSARIGKRMRLVGVDDFKSYLKMVKQDPEGEELVHLLDAISTNVTSFFRESFHFQVIAELFEGWLKAGQRRFRFWSAACSTGEEPYTLAITLAEVLGGKDVDLKILATDISTKVLDQAAQGEYLESKLAGVSAALRGKYFERLGARGEPTYRVKEELRRRIVFRRFNLSSPPFPMQGPLDVVLCRNVMIYFDNQVRQGLLSEVHRLLKPGGYLMVGHSESLNGISVDFETVNPSVYVKAR